MLARLVECQDIAHFLGEEFNVPMKEAHYVILSLPYERSTSYVQGTILGPLAILQASQQVEVYDEELDCESYRVGIYTDRSLEEPIQNIKSPEEVMGLVEGRARFHLEAGRHVIGLGGEHSITLGLARAYREKFPDISFLQIDAHGDLRDSYDGTPHSHACIMRRIIDFAPVVQVGIRSMCWEERELTRSKPDWPIFYDYQIQRDPQWIEKVVSRLSKNVFVTIDLDGFDPALIPAVGTPEPGGLSWYQGLALLRRVAQEKNIVGADVLELCPMEHDIRSDFITAKLVYKLIGYSSHSA